MKDNNNNTVHLFMIGPIKSQLLKIIYFKLKVLLSSSTYSQNTSFTC